MDTNVALPYFYDSDDHKTTPDSSDSSDFSFQPDEPDESTDISDMLTDSDHYLIEDSDDPEFSENPLTEQAMPDVVPEVLEATLVSFVPIATALPPTQQFVAQPPTASRVSSDDVLVNIFHTLSDQL